MNNNKGKKQQEWIELQPIHKDTNYYKISDVQSDPLLDKTKQTTKQQKNQQRPQKVQPKKQQTQYNNGNYRQINRNPTNYNNQRSTNNIQRQTNNIPRQTNNIPRQTNNIQRKTNNIPRMNPNQNNQARVSAMQNSRSCKIPMMTVACDSCTFSQDIPGNSTINVCQMCNSMSQCYPLYGLFICYGCKIHVCYPYGTSQFIRCTKCSTINKVPFQPMGIPKKHHAVKVQKSEKNKQQINQKLQSKKQVPIKKQVEYFDFEQKNNDHEFNEYEPEFPQKPQYKSQIIDIDEFPISNEYIDLTKQLEQIDFGKQQIAEKSDTD